MSDYASAFQAGAPDVTAPAGRDFNQRTRKRCRDLVASHLPESVNEELQRRLQRGKGIGCFLRSGL